MGNVTTQPLVPADEFTERMVNAIKTLATLQNDAVTWDNLYRLTYKRDAVATAADLWSATNAAVGKVPGYTLEIAYGGFEGGVKALAADAAAGPYAVGADEGYALVLDYLRGVGY